MSKLKPYLLPALAFVAGMIAMAVLADGITLLP